LHPRPKIRKPIRSKLVASTPLRPVCILSATIVCLALRELVTAWQQLSADVRDTIAGLARSQGDISRVGE
jgi:hypothetical protein